MSKRQANAEQKSSSAVAEQFEIEKYTVRWMAMKREKKVKRSLNIPIMEADNGIDAARYLKAKQQQRIIFCYQLNVSAQVAHLVSV